MKPSSLGIFCIFCLVLGCHGALSSAYPGRHALWDLRSGHKVAWPRLEQCYNVRKCKFFRVKLDFFVLDFDHLWIRLIHQPLFKQLHLMEPEFGISAFQQLSDGGKRSCTSNTSFKKTPIAKCGFQCHTGPWRLGFWMFLVLWESKSLPFSKCPSVNAYDVPLHAKFRAVHTALTCTHHSHEKVDTSWFHVMPDALCDLRNCRAKTRLSLATPFILWCWEVVPRCFKSCATLRHNCVW